MTTITGSVDRALNADSRFAIIRDSARGTNGRLSDEQIELCLSYIRTHFSVRGLMRYFLRTDQLFLGAGDCLSISGVDKICKVLEESSRDFWTYCEVGSEARSERRFRPSYSQTFTKCDPKRFYQIIDAILILAARRSYPVSLSGCGPSPTPWDGTYAESSSRIELRVDKDCYLTTHTNKVSVFPTQLFSTMAAYSVPSVCFPFSQPLSFKALRINDDLFFMRLKATQNTDNEWVIKVVPKGYKLTWKTRGTPNFSGTDKLPEKRIRGLNTDRFHEDSGVAGTISMRIKLEKLPSSTKIIKDRS